MEFSEDNSIAGALLRSYSIFDFVHGIHIGIELWEEYVLKALFYFSKIILELPILIRILQNLSQVRKIKKYINKRIILMIIIVIMMIMIIS